MKKTEAVVDNHCENLNKELRKAKRRRDMLLDEYNKRCEQLKALEKEVISI